jgi:hypothetical protein
MYLYSLQIKGDSQKKKKIYSKEMPSCDAERFLFVIENDFLRTVYTATEIFVFLK